MNRNGLFSLILAIIITVLSLWFNSFRTNNRNFQIINTEKKINFYLSDFTHLNTQTDGSMRYFIKGSNLIHQQSTKTNELINISLQAQISNGDITSLDAKKATQHSELGNIDFIGVVEVKKKSNISKAIITFNTSNLHYNPLMKTIHSKDKISLTSDEFGFGEIQGIGFSNKLDEQEIRIHSNVQATFRPAN